jgi:hypothetical protein
MARDDEGVPHRAGLPAGVLERAGLFSRHAALAVCLSMIFFGKLDSTFPDHALAACLAAGMRERQGRQSTCGSAADFLNLGRPAFRSTLAAGLESACEAGRIGHRQRTGFGDTDKSLRLGRRLHLSVRRMR